MKKNVNMNMKHMHMKLNEYEVKDGCEHEDRIVLNINLKKKQNVGVGDRRRDFCQAM